MLTLHKQIESYLDFCRYQKKLSMQTLKAYRIDLTQFSDYMEMTKGQLTRTDLSKYITVLHKQYRPKSIKRKIASLKAFCSYLEYEEILIANPFAKINVKFQEPFCLPRTIPVNIIEAILSTAYHHKKKETRTVYQNKTVLRDIAVLEMLFATGIRVSELCSLKRDDIDLTEGTIKIYGKGSKERIVQIGNPDVLIALTAYQAAFEEPIAGTGFFFINRLDHKLSEQSVRFIITKYTKLINVKMHITPHMFRHSFATLLLEEDVDIRYIQKLLGHSSIVTTQIYTHVTSKKQRDILSSKHPRNKMVL